MMMNWNGGMMNFGIGMGLFGWLLQIALFAAAIYLIAVLIKRVNHPDHADDSKAETILKERFARGEISEEEYRKMKQVLHD